MRTDVSVRDQYRYLLIWRFGMPSLPCLGWLLRMNAISSVPPPPNLMSRPLLYEVKQNALRATRRKKPKTPTESPQGKDRGRRGLSFLPTPRTSKQNLGFWKPSEIASRIRKQPRKGVRALLSRSPMKTPKPTTSATSPDVVSSTPQDHVSGIFDIDPVTTVQATASQIEVPSFAYLSS
ncbi:hypothetical protein FGADI_5313 [Fusarium gaditjirri]|uniref:Uncharacterized protein n=1 Tax=Fusarium gaditjirri TaxID=282569 RepID=A0A8H4TAN4_9HYPO|nr:hypothetical protein FGADI_5313 [Fusarium gaditjirri]